MDKPQHGMALITVMVFLLFMSVIGIEAMRSTALENRMSNNLQDQTHAFLLAEWGIARTFNRKSVFEDAIGAASGQKSYYASDFLGNLPGDVSGDTSGEPGSAAGPRKYLNTLTTYRGESTPGGEIMADVYSLDLVSRHNFNIHSSGRFNSAMVDLNRGAVQVGPKSRE